MATAREHSRKPDEAYAIAERLTPPNSQGRADLFSRERRSDWVFWGERGQ